MRGMSVCAKLGFNLHNLHNFHETTYKRPTFCDTCGGFVSPDLNSVVFYRNSAFLLILHSRPKQNTRLTLPHSRITVGPNLRDRF